MSLEPKTWIFQTNPNLYDIDTALGSLSEMSWLATAYKDQISPDDMAFLWRSGPEAGIIAEASVLTKPAMLEQGEEQSRFRATTRKVHRSQLRVMLRIVDRFGVGISRETLKSDARLLSQTHH